MEKEKETDYRKYKEKVEAMHPLVHCITNTVTINDCANLLLAAGASPTMAHHPEEVAEITAGCDALVCNLGAMDDFEAMCSAAPVAARLGHPIVVDPVGCGGSSFRRARFRELTSLAQVSCVRGNASEIRALAENAATVTGVDAAPESAEGALDELKKKVLILAQSLGCIVIASGAIDLLSDGSRVVEVSGGDPLMARITGSGCMSTALLGAFLAADYSLESAVAACRTMDHCGEIAAEMTRKEGRGTMTFRTYLIDEMSLM